MIHATMMGNFSGGVPNERGRVGCPTCGGWMSEGASQCNSCQATQRGKERSEQWQEKHEAGMFRRHRIFKRAYESGHSITHLMYLAKHNRLEEVA
jgi:hypothetical protein